MAGCNPPYNFPTLIPARAEHFLDHRDAVQCGRKAGVDRHLGHHLHDRLRLAARVQRAADVGDKLRARVAERGQGRDRREFSRAEVELRAGHHVAIGEVDYPVGELGRGLGDRAHCFGGLAAGDLVQGLAAAGAVIGAIGGGGLGLCLAAGEGEEERGEAA